MGDDIGVRRLVETLSAYYTEGRTVKEDLMCSLTNEFLANVQDVLFAKQSVVLPRWEFYIDIFVERMLVSPEMFLHYVFYACLYDAQFNFHIFERFLGAFAFILRICVETRFRNDVNFCKMVPDIFMVFYEKELKEPFQRRKGFQRFMKFINNPKYLESVCVLRNVTNSYDPIEFDFRIPEVYLEKAIQKAGRIVRLPEGFNFMEAEVHPESSSMAKKVLTITKTEFIPSLNVPDSTVSLSDLVNQKIAAIMKIKSEEKVESSELTSDQSFNFDSKTKDDFSEQMVDESWGENVIEAVIRYNHSKSSCLVKSNDHSQAETDVIMDHLKSKIEFLIELLDKYDKE